MLDQVWAQIAPPGWVHDPGRLLDRALPRQAFDLLAMKARAARAVRDADDLLLLRTLDLRTAGEVAEIAGRYFPDESLSDRSRQLIEDLLAEN